ncbi:MAG: hypothetical protein KJ047_13475 [Anaerolineae bacterium]|nr:hypothetical protein [Anaerolineae bacterium]
MKSTAERTVEALTWAAVVIWLGFALVAHLLGYVWLVVLVLSIILLSSAIYQRTHGWHTSLSIWVFGVWMAVFSMLEIVSMLVEAAGDGEGLRIDLWVYLGVALVSMGLAVIFRMINPNALVSEAGAVGRRGRRYEGDPRPHVPRHVVEESSAAYLPPAQERAGRGYGRTRREEPLYEERPDGYGGADEYAYDEDRQAPRPRREHYFRPPGYEPPIAPDQDIYQEPYEQRADYRYGGAEPPYAPAEAARYSEPDPYAPADYASAPPDGYVPRAPRRPDDRRRAARQPRPAEAPSDLQARIDDIIRRSRERRNVPPEDLPY